MLEELEQSLPVAMLFLKRLRAIEIKLSGQQVRAYQRMDDSDSLILSDGDRMSGNSSFFRSSVCLSGQEHNLHTELLPE